MRWLPLRKSSLEDLAVSMTGVKLGDRLLVVGCADPYLIAQIAVKTGLTGRAFAIDEDEHAVAAAARIVSQEGALIETAAAPWGAAPLESESFDVVVLRDVLPHLAAADRDACLRDVRRVLRPGGRCLVIDGKGRGRLMPVVRRGPGASDYREAEGPVRVLTTLGLKPARILAEREGLLFAEAFKPAQG
jgi:ubiquinone/menaquinone biosynthesis C-methylase UbiE